MSYFATLDGRAVADVATNFGMRDFSDWVLEFEGIEALQYLIHYGESEELEDVEQNLIRALKIGEPTSGQRCIGEGLLAVLRGRGVATVLIVSDGTGEGEVDEKADQG